MALAMHILAFHEVTRLLAVGGRGIAAVSPPNPAPKEPPGLTGPVTTIIAWGKWGVLVCGLAGLLMCAGKMAIGHRNRATFAAAAITLAAAGSILLDRPGAVPVARPQSPHALWPVTSLPPERRLLRTRRLGSRVSQAQSWRG